MKKIVSYMCSVVIACSCFIPLVYAESNEISFNKERHEINIPRVDLSVDKSYQIDRTVNIWDLISFRAVGDKHRLAVETRVQEKNYYCGPASVQQILKYKGYNQYSQDQLAYMLGTSKDYGTNFRKIREVLNKILYNLNRDPNPQDYAYRDVWFGEVINDQNREDFAQNLKANIKTNDPIIAWVDVFELYGKAYQGGHYVTVTGYKEGANGSIESVYYVDPWGVVQDSQYQGLKVISFEEFMQAMKGKGYVW